MQISPYVYGETNNEGSIVLGGCARLPEAQIAVAIADAEFVALLGEATARDLGKGARGAWTADGLLMSPLPDLHRAILAASQVERHQRMRAHALHIVHLVTHYLEERD